MNILFYSNKCVFCKKIVNLINDVDDINSYKLICIDNNIGNFKFIQRVPTLLINEKKPLVGVNAFKWIQAKNQFNNDTNNINFNPNKNLGKDTNPLIYGDDDNLNLSNTSNKFSDIDEVSKIDSNIINNQKIFTLPEGDRINNKVQKQKLNKLLSLRTKQDTTITNDIDITMSSQNDDNQLINNNINKIKFTSLPNGVPKTTTDINLMGIKTNRNIIDKNKYI
tara:strand:+ start:261 stop:929 length:669 start_codon:yes stop_codon:yes gene_type:complete